MGGCCHKLESIDHVYSLLDLRYILNSDIELFIRQNRILQEDKEKKVDYFNYLISNLKIVEKDLNDLKRLDDENVTQFKLKYRSLMHTVYSQDQFRLEKSFTEIYDFMEIMMKLDKKNRNKNNLDETITPTPTPTNAI